MRVEWDPAKERRNIAKHGLDFSFGRFILSDPMAVETYDRFEEGEHRWHILAMAGARLLLLVCTYPDPDDLQWVRIIGLRQGTSHERKRYEACGDG